MPMNLRNQLPFVEKRAIKSWNLNTRLINIHLMLVFLALNVTSGQEQIGLSAPSSQEVIRFIPFFSKSFTGRLKHRSKTYALLKRRANSAIGQGNFSAQSNR